jgi:hypothetical protein
VEVVKSTDLVGLIMSAPIWFGSNLRSLRISFSRIGITKLGVIPGTVIASTMASSCYVNNGVAAAWTGVIWECPIASVTLKLQGRSEITSSWSLSNARTPMRLGERGGRPKCL